MSLFWVLSFAVRKFFNSSLKYIFVLPDCVTNLLCVHLTIIKIQCSLSSFKLACWSIISFHMVLVSQGSTQGYGSGLCVGADGILFCLVIYPL